MLYAAVADMLTYVFFSMYICNIILGLGLLTTLYIL